MNSAEQQYRRDIVEIGHLMYEKGWVAANDGNISVRLDDGTILCTPTNISKGRMTEDDLIVVNLDGEKLRGTRERTSEILLHLTVYQLRPDIKAVVHAHPPTATGFAAAGRALDHAVLPEVVVSLGVVPLARYGLPGTPALTQPMLPLIPKYDAILMANHGAVAYADELWKAFYKLETVEHTARILLVAEMLGGARVLSRDDVSALYESRNRYGVQSRNQMEPGLPVVAENLKDREETPVTRSEFLLLLDEVMRIKDGSSSGR